jgi:hypothetical protein
MTIPPEKIEALKQLARDWHDGCFQSRPIELGSHAGIAVRLDWLGELVQERDDLAREVKRLERENSELANPIYCKECGSCGETGCCGVHKCLYVKAHQGDYDDLAKENAWLRGLLRECQERLDGTNKSDELWRKINAALGEK